MVAFQEKQLDDRTIGDILRAAREERRETLEDAERATRVTKKHIDALECNDLKRLPETVYTKKFVKALAAHYGLDPEAASESLLKEMAAGAGAVPTKHPANFIAGRSLSASPLLFKSVIMAAAFVAIVSYFAFSIQSILKPPALTLYSPQDDQVFSTERVVLEGTTEPEVELTVNGDPVDIEADGSFKEMLNLPPGVSHLRLVAKKKHSKTHQQLIKVVVEEPRETASATGTPFGL